MGNPVEAGYVTTSDMQGLEVEIDMEKLVARGGYVDISGAFERAIENGLDEFGERLYDKAMENLSDMGLGGSNLAGTVTSRRITDGVELSVGADYAVYVEYGTGMVGADNPHPDPASMNWEYAIGEKINPVTGYWKYPKGITRGQPSRPFIYRTVSWGRHSIYNIVRKHFNREMKKQEVK